jgi:hypothetical protein
MPKSPSHQAFAALVAAGVALGLPAHAEDVPVPINLQAELLFMMAAEDKNLPERAGEVVRVLVVVKPGEEAARAAAQFQAAAAAGKPKVAGLPHAEEVVQFSGATALAATCKARSASIVYLAPGFTGAEATAIGQALEGGNVLTASAEPGLVKKGVVLGFDLVAGRAKLLVDLTQAGKQRVSFSAEVLRLVAVSR